MVASQDVSIYMMHASGGTSEPDSTSRWDIVVHIVHIDLEVKQWPDAKCNQ